MLTLSSVEPLDTCWQRLGIYFAERPALLDALCAKLGWTRGYAQRALREYQRFCWLAVRSGHVVSPSAQVDQIWHLHLQYSRDYWSVFCPRVLGTELHHEPGESSPEARLRYQAQYAETLARYQQSFGPPPIAFWPALDQMPRYRWIEQRVAHPGSRWAGRGISRAVTALLILLFAVPARAALGPLDWAGPSFLGLFAALMPAALIASLLLRRTLRGVAGGQPAGMITRLEYAYLAGGTVRLMDAAVAELLSRGLVRWEDRSGLLTRGDPTDLAPELRSVFNAIRGQPQPDRLLQRLEPTLQPLRASLQRRGLLLDADAARRTRMLSAAIPAALLMFGLAKIVIGLSRERPVGILVVFCLMVAAYTLVLLFKQPRRSRRGDAVLARARAEHTAALRAPRAQDLGLAVALLGTAAMTGTAYAAYHQARSPAGDSSSSSSDSSSGDGDGGGSGCGGCGGD